MEVTCTVFSDCFKGQPLLVAEHLGVTPWPCPGPTGTSAPCLSPETALTAASASKAMQGDRVNVGW